MQARNARPRACFGLPGLWPWRGASLVNDGVERSDGGRVRETIV